MTDARYPSLAGRTVLVTGGGSGIGAELTRHFVRQGCKVGFIDIAQAPSRALVEELAGAGTLHYEPADLTDIAALRSAVEAVRARLGPITVLVNNAARDQRHRFLEVTPDSFDAMVAGNFRHVYFATQAVVPDMVAAGGGSIVNFGSTSWLVGSPDLSVYASVKAGIQGLTRVIAREFGPDKVRCNCLLPGWTMTERQVTLWLTPEAEAETMKKQCIPRRLLPEDVARAALFLASDDSAGMTNQTMVVDLGWL